ncbi:MAG: ABC transporter permease subunit [Anaerolineae bacterium]|nr:ABC transporter permease subunit [Anaerolineae bacterium]
MTHESLSNVEACAAPRTLTDRLFYWTDRAPWWVLVLVGLGILVFLFIISPARMMVDRQVPTVGASAAGSFVYTLEVKNAGPAEAVGISLTEELAEGLKLVSADPAPTSAEGALLQWDLSAIKAGRSTTVEITVQATGGGVPGDLVRASTSDLSWTTVSIDILRFLALGMRVTILVTLYSFILAVFMGLVAGLGRVAKQPEGLSSVLRWEFIWKGALRVAAGIAIYYVLAQFVDRAPALTTRLVIVLAVLLYLAPRVLHPYTMATMYVEVFRGIPMLVQVLYLGFVIRPFVKTFLSEALGTQVEFSEFNAAVLGLGLGYGAYIAEVFRAGIQSIHRGQMEAARSLGMNYSQAMRHVILPQAIRRVLPPLANDGVALLKDSSFVSVLSVADLTRQGRLYMSRTYRAFESWNMVAVSYLVMTFLFSGLARALERRMSQGER